MLGRRPRLVNAGSRKLARDTARLLVMSRWLGAGCGLTAQECFRQLDGAAQLVRAGLLHLKGQGGHWLGQHASRQHFEQDVWHGLPGSSQGQDGDGEVLGLGLASCPRLVPREGFFAGGKSCVFRR